MSHVPTGTDEFLRQGLVNTHGDKKKQHATKKVFACVCMCVSVACACVRARTCVCVCACAPKRYLRACACVCLSVCLSVCACVCACVKINFLVVTYFKRLQSTLQYTATHCNTLQHTATHSSISTPIPHKKAGVRIPIPMMQKKKSQKRPLQLLVVSANLSTRN